MVTPGSQTPILRNPGPDWWAAPHERPRRSQSEGALNLGPHHLNRRTCFVTTVVLFNGSCSGGAVVLDHPGGSDRVCVGFGYVHVFRAPSHLTGE